MVILAVILMAFTFALWGVLFNGYCHFSFVNQPCPVREKK